MRVLITVLTLFLAYACSDVAAPPEVSPGSDSRSVAYTAGDSWMSAAVQADQVVYLSGQSDLDREMGVRPDGVEARTRQAMDNVGEVLALANLDHSDLVSCRLQLADMDDYQTVNGAYASYFGEAAYPARTTVEVVSLPEGSSIVVTCVAYRDSASTTIVRPPADEIPPAMGPYSPAVMAGNMLYLSGQGGRDPLTNQISEDAAQQAARTMETIETILRAAGLSAGNVVTIQSFYPRPNDLSLIEGRLAGRFEAGSAPAAGYVPVGRLPGDIAVEITVVASRGTYSVTRLHPTGQTPGSSSSPAVLVGDVLYLETLEAHSAGDSLEDQFRAVMRGHETNLALADMALTNVAYADLFLADLGDSSTLERLMREYFPQKPPAVTLIGIGPSRGSRVAIGLIAAR